MNRILKSALVAALVLPSAAFAADPPKSAACFDLKFTVDFLNTFPKAPAVCQEVIVRDGVKYARLAATILRNADGIVTVGFKNVFGTVISEVDVKPTAESKLTINDKTVYWKNVKKGDTINVYVNERNLSIGDRPGGDGTNAPMIIKSR